MRYRPMWAQILGLGLAIGPLSAAAQELPTGTWTGVVQLPNGANVPSQFEVASTPDGVTITWMVPSGASFDATEVTVEAGRITFTIFAPGEARCDLEVQEDGSYEGGCLGSEDRRSSMTMIPPENG